MKDVPLTFTVNEPTSWTSYSLDGQGQTTITGNTTLNGLAEGEHKLIVYGNGTLGNMGNSDTIYFTIQTTQTDDQHQPPFPTTLVPIIASAALVLVALTGLALYRKRRIHTKKSAPAAR